MSLILEMIQISLKNKDKNYLSDNPNRRLPNIKRSKNLLNFRPKIDIKLGIKKYLTYLKYRTNITKNKSEKVI